MTKTKQTRNPAREDEGQILAPSPPSKGKIYAIDQHPDVNVVAVVTGNTPHNMVVEQTKGSMDLDTLINWLKKRATEDDLVLVEAGAGCFELSGRLLDLNIPCCVLESSWIGQQAHKYVDNDKMAATRIAKVFLQGNAPAVWVPDQQSKERRQLLHLHIIAKRDKTRATNALKGYLTSYGIRTGSKTLTNKGNQEWIKNRREWSSMELLVLEDYFKMLETTSVRSRDIEVMIASEITSTPQMLQLMSLLGIGKINAFALIATIGDIRRFSNPKKLASYLGLNPNQKSSGNNKMIRTGVGNRGRKDMRSLLIQGAQAVLRKASTCPLGSWGMKLLLRKGNRNVAVAAIARKLAVQVWHLLMGHQPDLLIETKSRNLKFRNLLVSLGKERRQQMGLPKTLELCYQYFNQLIQENTLNHKKTLD